MQALSLYVSGDTIIHKSNPITKITYIISAILIPIIFPIKAVIVLFTILSIIVLLLGRVLKRIFPLIGVSALVLLSVVIIQGLFNTKNTTPLFQIGQLIFYKEGLFYAFGIVLRVLNILCSFAILVLTTRPSDLIEALVRKGLSPRIGYVLNSIFQIIPQMITTMDTITNAQKSRGMETEGSLPVRMKAFFPLIGPVVMSSLINTRERAMALEVRGFNSNVKKTFLNEQKETSFDKVIQLILIALIPIAIIWRIFL